MNRNSMFQAKEGVLLFLVSLVAFMPSYSSSNSDLGSSSDRYNCKPNNEYYSQMACQVLDYQGGDVCVDAVDVPLDANVIIVNDSSYPIAIGDFEMRSQKSGVSNTKFAVWNGGHPNRSVVNIHASNYYGDGKDVYSILQHARKDYDELGIKRIRFQIKDGEDGSGGDNMGVDCLINDYVVDPYLATYGLLDSVKILDSDNTDNGHVLFDVIPMHNGAPFYELDDNGDPVYAVDEHGIPIYEYDESGNYVLDDNGNPIREQVLVKVECTRHDYTNYSQCDPTGDF